MKGVEKGKNPYDTEDKSSFPIKAGKPSEDASPFALKKLRGIQPESQTNSLHP